MAASYHDDAQVLLRSAELYQSMGMPPIASWVHSDGFPTTDADFVTAYPPGSDRFSDLTRYARFYETLATLWKHDVFDEGLLLDWLFVPWSRVGDVLVGLRTEWGVPQLWENFEALGAAQDRTTDSTA